MASWSNNRKTGNHLNTIDTIVPGVTQELTADTLDGRAVPGVSIITANTDHKIMTHLPVITSSLLAPASNNYDASPLLASNNYGAQSLLIASNYGAPSQPAPSNYGAPSQAASSKYGTISLPAYILYDNSTSASTRNKESFLTQNAQKHYSKLTTKDTNNPNNNVCIGDDHPSCVFTRGMHVPVDETRVWYPSNIYPKLLEKTVSEGPKMSRITATSLNGPGFHKGNTDCTGKRSPIMTNDSLRPQRSLSNSVTMPIPLDNSSSSHGSVFIRRNSSRNELSHITLDSSSYPATLVHSRAPTASTQSIQTRPAITMQSTMGNSSSSHTKPAKSGFTFHPRPASKNCFSYQLFETREDLNVENSLSADENKARSSSYFPYGNEILFHESSSINEAHAKLRKKEEELRLKEEALIKREAALNINITKSQESPKRSILLDIANEWSDELTEEDPNENLYADPINENLHVDPLKIVRTYQRKQRGYCKPETLQNGDTSVTIIPLMNNVSSQITTEKALKPDPHVSSFYALEKFNLTDEADKKSVKIEKASSHQNISNNSTYSDVSEFSIQSAMTKKTLNTNVAFKRLMDVLPTKLVASGMTKSNPPEQHDSSFSVGASTLRPVTEDLHAFHASLHNVNSGGFQEPDPKLSPDHISLQNRLHADNLNCCKFNFIEKNNLKYIVEPSMPDNIQSAGIQSNIYVPHHRHGAPQESSVRSRSYDVHKEGTKIAHVASYFYSSPTKDLTENDDSDDSQTVLYTHETLPSKSNKIVLDQVECININQVPNGDCMSVSNNTAQNYFEPIDRQHTSSQAIPDHSNLIKPLIINHLVSSSKQPCITTLRTSSIPKIGGPQGTSVSAMPTVNLQAQSTLKPESFFSVAAVSNKSEDNRCGLGSIASNCSNILKLSTSTTNIRTAEDDFMHGANLVPSRLTNSQTVINSANVLDHSKVKPMPPEPCYQKIPIVSAESIIAFQPQQTKTFLPLSSMSGNDNQLFTPAQSTPRYRLILPQSSATIQTNALAGSSFMKPAGIQVVNTAQGGKEATQVEHLPLHVPHNRRKWVDDALVGTDQRRYQNREMGDPAERPTPTYRVVDKFVKQNQIVLQTNSQKSFIDQEVYGDHSFGTNITSAITPINTSGEGPVSIKTTHSALVTTCKTTQLHPGSECFPKQDRGKLQGLLHQEPVHNLIADTNFYVGSTEVRILQQDLPKVSNIENRSKKFERKKNSSFVQSNTSITQTDTVNVQSRLHCNNAINKCEGVNSVRIPSHSSIQTQSTYAQSIHKQKGASIGHQLTGYSLHNQDQPNIHNFIHTSSPEQQQQTENQLAHCQQTSFSHHLTQPLAMLEKTHGSMTLKSVSSANLPTSLHRNLALSNRKSAAIKRGKYNNGKSEKSQDAMTFSIDQASSSSSEVHLPSKRFRLSINQPLNSFDPAHQSTVNQISDQFQVPFNKTATVEKIVCPVEKMHPLVYQKLHFSDQALNLLDQAQYLPDQVSSIPYQKLSSLDQDSSIPDQTHSLPPESQSFTNQTQYPSDHGQTSPIQGNSSRDQSLQRHHRLEHIHSLLDPTIAQPVEVQSLSDKSNSASAYNHSPPVHVHSPQDRVYSPPDDVCSPQDQVHSSPDQVHSSSYQVHSPPDLVHAPPDQVHSPADRVHSPADQVHSPADQVHSPADQVHSSADQVHSPADQVHSPADQIHSPADQVHSPPKLVRYSQDHVLAPPDHAHAPPDHAHALPDHAHAPPDQVHAPPDQVHAPPDQVHAPPDQVHAPPDQVHAPPDQVQSSLDQVQSSLDLDHSPSNNGNSLSDQAISSSDQNYSFTDQANNSLLNHNQSQTIHVQAHHPLNQTQLQHDQVSSLHSGTQPRRDQTQHKHDHVQVSHDQTQNRFAEAQSSFDKLQFNVTRGTTLRQTQFYSNKSPPPTSYHAHHHSASESSFPLSNEPPSPQCSDRSASPYDHQLSSNSDHPPGDEVVDSDSQACADNSYELDLLQSRYNHSPSFGNRSHTDMDDEGNLRSFSHRPGHPSAIQLEINSNCGKALDIMGIDQSELMASHSETLSLQVTPPISGTDSVWNESCAVVAPFLKTADVSATMPRDNTCADEKSSLKVLQNVSLPQLGQARIDLAPVEDIPALAETSPDETQQSVLVFSVPNCINIRQHGSTTTPISPHINSENYLPSNLTPNQNLDRALVTSKRFDFLEQSSQVILVEQKFQIPTPEMPQNSNPSDDIDSSFSIRSPSLGNSMIGSFSDDIDCSGNGLYTSVQIPNGTILRKHCSSSNRLVPVEDDRCSESFRDGNGNLPQGLIIKQIGRCEALPPSETGVQPKYPYENSFNSGIYQPSVDGSKKFEDIKQKPMCKLQSKKSGKRSRGKHKKAANKTGKKAKIDSIILKYERELGDFKYVACGKCPKRDEPVLFSSIVDFQKHANIVHNGMARPEGMSQEFSLVEMRSAQKAVLSSGLQLRCPTCEQKMKSQLGFENHIQWCGKSIEERFTPCPNCGKECTMFTLKPHLRECQESSESVVVKVPPPPRLSRQAKIKFRNNLREKLADVMDEEDCGVLNGNLTEHSDSYQNSEKYLLQKLCRKARCTVIPLEQTKEWFAALESKSDLKCYYKNCLFTTNTTVEDIERHSLTCENGTEDHYLCNTCTLEHPLSFEDIVHHISKKHSNDVILSSLKPLLSSPRKFVSPVRRKISNFDDNSLALTLAFRRDHHAEVLFPEWQVRLQDWEILPEPKDWLPCRHQSPQYTVVEADQGSWQTLPLFGGRTLDNASYFFCGGEITSSAWCPVPHDAALQQKTNQYLAVAASSQETDVEVSKPFSRNEILQFWNCSVLNSLNEERKAPKLEFAIAHNFGSVLCLQWCPSGIYENSTDSELGHTARLGIVAAACSSGEVNLWIIPHPNLLPASSDTRVFKKLPDIILKQVGFDGDENSCFPMKIDWLPSKGHSKIAASMNDGSVHIWQFGNSPLLRNFSKVSQSSQKSEIYYPCKSMQCHLGAAEAVAWCPNTVGDTLATGGRDRMHHLWDLQEGQTSRLSSVRREMVTDTKWPLNSTATSLAFDDVYFLEQSTTAMRECGFFGTNISYCKSNSTTWNISISDPLSAVLQATDDGDCGVTLHSDLYRLASEKSKRQCRFNYRVEKKRLSPSPVDDTTNQTESLSDAVSRYGLVFYNMPDRQDSSSRVFNSRLTHLPSVASRVAKGSKNGKKHRAPPPEDDEEEERGPADPATFLEHLLQYPLASATNVSFNTNIGAHHWLFMGYRCGLARIVCLSQIKRKTLHPNSSIMMS